MTEPDFRALADAALHASAEELATFLAAGDRKHGTNTDYFIRQAIARRTAAATQPCAF